METKDKKPTKISVDNGAPIVGKLPLLLGDIIGTFRNMRAQNGGLVQFKLPLENAYLISQPELVKQVFIGGEPSYTKGKYTKSMEAIFGRGLLTAEGKHWQRQRKLLQPIFSNASCEKWITPIVDCIEKRMSQWEECAEQGNTIDAASDARLLLQEIMANIMFGSSISKEEGLKAAKLMTMVSDGLVGEFFRTTIFGPLSKLIPTPSAMKFRAAIQEFDKIVDKALSTEGHEKDECIASMFRSLRYPDDGKPMSPRQFRDEVATFFFAGQETTATALAWSLYFLSQDERSQSEVAQEGASFRASEKGTRELKNHLVFTSQVVNEALRMKPPAYAVERRTSRNEGVNLDGCALKRDSLVVLAPGVSHVDENEWTDPFVFRPERFNPEEQKKRHPFAYIPFGAGARKCIGMNLSILELTVALSLISEKFEYKLAEGTVVHERTGITLRPHPSLPLKMKIRQWN